MINSMTAFARQAEQFEAGEFVWELRSVNHRYLDIFVRLPEELRAFESDIRSKVSQRLRRGKVDLQLRYRPAESDEQGLRLNENLLARMNKVLRQVSIHIPDVKSPTSIEVLRWPGVVMISEVDQRQLKASVFPLLERALEELVATRSREGARLAEIITKRTAACRVLVEQVKTRMPLVVEQQRQRLQERFSEILGRVDADRVEQELALLIQQLDIDEEMDRLNTHLDEVERILKKGGVIGRRLDFLMQELNRETNTLASKSIDVETTQAAIELKVLIEQMREQMQNLE